MHTFTAYVASGHGARLPAIYGLESMQAQDAVIILRDGQQSIVFPGADGYKIHWSEGTRVIPLSSTPSGHLVIECDKFDNAQASQSGDALTFVMDHSRNGSS